MTRRPMRRRIARIRARLFLWVVLHRAKLAHALRVALAAVLSLAAAQLLHLTLPLWSVLTAMLVTQISLGKSLKATVDYLYGTVSGAAFGALVALAIPHADEWALLAVLAIAVAPLAALAAVKPNFAVAPATAAIVILLPEMSHATSIASAISRVAEVLVGGGIALAVSFLGPRRDT